MERNMNAAAATVRTTPFVIDLNEIPDDVICVGEVTNKNGGGASGGVDDDVISYVVIVCSICGRSYQGRENRRDWICFKCLMTNAGRSGSGSISGGGGGGGKGVVLDLDMNAMPPEAEGEECVFVNVRNDLNLAATRGRSQITHHRSRVHTNIQGDYKMSIAEQASYALIQTQTRNIHSRSFNSFPNKVYLQCLREKITEWGGILGDGWFVEFVFNPKKVKTLPIYHAPDGNKFETVPDVASHLGLQPKNGSTVQNTNATCGPHRVHDGFPIQYEDFFLVSLGKIDARPTYYSTTQIWPIGYKSSWHDKITGSFFNFEVSEGGDSGPLFKVKRFPCTTQDIPIGSTILSSSEMENKIKEEDSAIFGYVDDESNDIQMMLNDSTSPDLGNDITWSDTSSNNNSNVSSIPVDPIGSFLVEATSGTLAWEMACETFLQNLTDSYTQKDTVQFCCNHEDVQKTRNKSIDSLSKFSSLSGPNNIPEIIQNDAVTFKITYQTLAKWLRQDRFGLDTEFVQEMIEQLSEVSLCTHYKTLKERSQISSPLKTVGNGSLLAKRKIDEDYSYESSKRAKKYSQLDQTRPPFPISTPLSVTLPAYLIGDAFQVWEFSRRFSEILKLEEAFSFQELEHEFLNPWLDKFHPLVKGTPEIGAGLNGAIPKARVVCETQSKFTGLFLSDMHVSLLNMLASELLSRVAVYVDPNFEAGESKSKRGRKRDSDISASIKKMMRNMLPINEFTWPEVARRYILAVLSMDCILDSSEIAFRESGKVFQCLRGDGGTLCGSLTGVAALEADAMLLAEASKRIFDSIKTESDIVNMECKVTDSAGPSKSVDKNMPEWALILEPVRKLPTNVGARIRKCINEALEKNPPDWAKKALEHSISKEVYKGNASGPTKRAVVSVLTDLEKMGPQQIEKKEKPKLMNTLSDLRMRQCRIVLRRVSAGDTDKVFCNLLGRVPLINPSDNDDEGLLGYPAMVSRPLDFRSIDLRLAFGAYNGSHEAFFEDVQEVWHNIRIAYRDHPDLIELAEKLSKRFEDLYNEEVVTIAKKIAECTNPNTLNSEAEKQRNDVLAYVSENSIPKAPWEEGICKICGMDKDDDNVLLCDNCDSEYHTYCLNPPLVKVPEGNWYCSSCVSQTCTAITSHLVLQSKKTKPKKHKYLLTLAQLANTMVIREYWELNAEERVFLMKFLCDEALQLSVFREHMEQSMSLTSDLQQKLRTLTSELKIQKMKEDFMSVKNNSEKEEIIVSPSNELNESSSSMQVESTPLNLQEAITNVESEMIKVCLRKECLGRDSNGRIYWICNRPGYQTCILVNSIVSSETLLTNITYKSLSSTRDEFSVRKWYTSEQSNSSWVTFDSDSEILQLLGWLKDDDEREKELKESILLWQRNKSKLEKKEANSCLKSYKKTEYPVTKALEILKKKFGSGLDTVAVISNHSPIKEGILYRCHCLEPLWSTKEHCLLCHQSFVNLDEHTQHIKSCKISRPVPQISQKNEISRGKKTVKYDILHEKSSASVNNNDKVSTVTVSYFDQHHYDPECPFNYEEIKSKFVLPSSLKDLVRELGFMDSNGTSSSSSSVHDPSPFYNDPSLRVGPGLESKQESSMPIVKNKSMRSKSIVREGSFSRNRNVIHGSALRPLLGNLSIILDYLKINLLDMECAIPEAALRGSRSLPERLRAWRVFTKSATTIYEMIQAIITLEDMIKGERLRKDWWYWSSPSTAAKTTTLSALALRIYALDAAIIYEKTAPVNGGDVDMLQVLKPCLNVDPIEESPQAQSPPDSEAPESSRARTRVSKRRRDALG